MIAQLAKAMMVPGTETQWETASQEWVLWARLGIRDAGPFFNGMVFHVGLMGWGTLIRWAVYRRPRAFVGLGCLTYWKI